MSMSRQHWNTFCLHSTCHIHVHVQTLTLPYSVLPVQHTSMWNVECGIWDLGLGHTHGLSWGPPRRVDVSTISCLDFGDGIGCAYGCDCEISGGWLFLMLPVCIVICGHVRFCPCNTEYSSGAPQCCPSCHSTPSVLPLFSLFPSLHGAPPNTMAAMACTFSGHLFLFL